MDSETFRLGSFFAVPVAITLTLLCVTGHFICSIAGREACPSLTGMPLTYADMERLYAGLLVTA